ncbi:MAG: glycine cleavage system protein R [Armatimonadota bacterium]
MPLIAITAIGRDHPGIVAGFSSALYRAGCNLQDCTMTRLGGEFAMIILAQTPEDQDLAALEESIAATSRVLGLTTLLRSVSPEEIEPVSTAGQSYIVRVYGADRPGIMSEVTSLLARHRWNITDLSSQLLSGAAGPVYVMMLEVDAAGNGVAALEAELAQLARRLQVEIGFEPLQAEAL